MAKIELTELAYEDLEHITAYIAHELSNPDASLHFLDKVECCYGLLRENPLMYELCHDERLANASYRKAVIDSYVMVHRYDESLDKVIILRFFYGAQNYIEQL